MIHTIINPSDPYTIESEDLSVLTAAIFILGEGAYGTESNDTDFKVPLTIFGGQSGVDFFQETFNTDLHDFIDNNRLKISQCLASVVLGTITDRELFTSAISHMDEINKDKFVKEWYEKKQSSLNGIGQRAKQLSEILIQ